MGSPIHEGKDIVALEIPAYDLELELVWTRATYPSKTKIEFVCVFIVLLNAMIISGIWYE